MKKILQIVLIVGVVIVVGIQCLVFLTNNDLGQAPTGLATTGQTATTTQVGPQETVELFSKNTSCNSRVVGTTDGEVTLLFFDPSNGDLASTTLSAVAGFIQSASTTQAYDSGLYGCGRVFGYSAASTTIITSEFK